MTFWKFKLRIFWLKVLIFTMRFNLAAAKIILTFNEGVLAYLEKKSELLSKEVDDNARVESSC
jgi:hypothetical protein